MGLLAECVALVTGASRGAGRGIARELGAQGATVYVTGRSSRSSPGRAPGTVEETAAEVTARGGRGIPVVCDHTDDGQVAELFARIAAKQGKLDLLVNNAWGGNAFAPTDAPFWEMPWEHWRLNIDAGPRATLLASRHAAALMLPARRGLIIDTTYFDRGRFSANVFYDLSMNAQCRLAWGMALDLKPHGIAAVALSPGFMRTELVLAAFGASEERWRHVAALRGSESTTYIGRAVVALASDPEILRRTGQSLLVGELARAYGFTDADGTQPEPFPATMGTRGT